MSYESASEDLEALRHMFRDIVPKDEARQANEERSKRVQEQQKQRDETHGKRDLVAWPTDLMFLMRTIELLQGVCTKLETRHPFMKTMSDAARQALREFTPPAQRAKMPVYPPLSGASISPLEQRLREVMKGLRERDGFLGMQLCVIQNNKVVRACL